MVFVWSIALRPPDLTPLLCRFSDTILQQKRLENQDHDQIQAAIANVRKSASEPVKDSGKDHSISSSAKKSAKGSVKKTDGNDGIDVPPVVPEGEVVLQELGLSQEQVGDFP